MAALAVSKIVSYNTGIGTGVIKDLGDYDNGATENEITGVGRVSNLGIVVKNTAADTKVLTFKAGDEWGNKSQGDLAINLTQNVEYHVQLEANRFLNEDGSIEFTCEAGATGSISCVELLD